MQEENYINIKSGNRISEDSISFIVEELRFQINILIIENKSVDLNIKEIASGANYVLKKNLSDFLKNEIFKTSQNLQTVKELIFKMIINSFSKIGFYQNKCYLKLSLGNQKTQVSGIDSNFLLEFEEDSDISSIVQNFLKKTEDIEKENKALKLELEKLKREFISLKEENNIEKSQIIQNETENKQEIFSLKKKSNKNLRKCFK